MKKLLALLLLLPVLAFAGEEHAVPLLINQDGGNGLPAVETFVFGQSEQGRDLYCTRLGPEDAQRKILMVFAIHGFEDLYAQDGQILVDIAHEMISRYAQGEALPENAALYIVPCANPDGLSEGEGVNGFGRCNALGININRDFPIDWAYTDIPRNQTGEAPFSTSEAKAISDLIDAVSPTWGMDVHGFLSGVYGPDNLTEPFRSVLKVVIRENNAGGLLSKYLNSRCPEGGMLIELDKPGEPKSRRYIEKTAAQLMEGIARVEASRP